MKKKSFARGDLIEVDWAGSWILATYVEECAPLAPGGQASHVVRMRSDLADHSFSPRRIREATVPRIAAKLLRTAERVLVEDRDPMPVLTAARRLGVDLRGPAWSLAVKARAAAGGDRDERQLQRATALIESGQLMANGAEHRSGDAPKRRRV